MSLRTAGAFALALATSVPAFGQEKTDPATLEERVRALETQLAETRAALDALREEAPVPAAAPKQAGPVEPPGLKPLDLAPGSSTGQVTSGTAFNPAISVITEGLYYADDRSGGAVGFFGGADGFAGTPAGEGRDLKRGFNLGETEVVFSGAVDPYFDATAIASLGADGISLEEAYGRTRNLPAGLALKAGKFYSGVGYLNGQHPHQWAFVDRALAYEVLLGGALNDVGLQLTWLPKTPVYVQLGLEAFQGENAGVAHVHGADADPAFSDKAGPRLFTGFLKVAPDVGYSDALQGGLFAGRSSLHQEESAEGPLEGTAWFAGTDWVYKHDSPSPGGKGDVVLQAEYVYREKKLDRIVPGDAAAAGSPVRSRQDGFYVQGTWGFAPRLTASARYDAVGAFVNEVGRGALGLADYDASRRLSAALTFNPTEFSRVRAQFSRGDAAVGGARETFSQFFLQLQLSLGVHGAHKF